MYFSVTQPNPSYTVHTQNNAYNFEDDKEVATELALRLLEYYRDFPQSAQERDIELLQSMLGKKWVAFVNQNVQESPQPLSFRNWYNRIYTANMAKYRISAIAAFALKKMIERNGAWCRLIDDRLFCHHDGVPPVALTRKITTQTTVYLPPSTSEFTPLLHAQPRYTYLAIARVQCWDRLKQVAAEAKLLNSIAYSMIYRLDVSMKKPLCDWIFCSMC